MKRTYGKKKRSFLTSFSDSRESNTDQPSGREKKTNNRAISASARTSALNQTDNTTHPSHNDTIDDLAELLLDDTTTMEEEEKPAVEPEKRQSSCLLSAQTMPSLPASSHGSKPLPSYASLVPVESSRLDSTGRQGSGPPIPPKSSRRQPTNTTVVVTYPDNSSPNALLTDLGHQELTTVRCLESGRLTGDQLYWMAHENEKLRVANEAKKAELEAQATLQSHATLQSQIAPKKNKLKDNKVLKKVKDVMTFRGRDSRKRESSVYDESKPLLSDSLDEKVDLEGEDEISMKSGGLEKGEVIYVKESDKRNGIPRKRLVSDEMSSANEDSTYNLPRAHGLTETISTQDNMSTNDSSYLQQITPGTQRRTSTYMTMVDGSPGFGTRNDSSGMDTTDSSSSLPIPVRQLRRRTATISINSDAILTSSPIAQSTPNGRRHPSLRYSDSQSHLRIPPGRAQSPWIPNTEMVASVPGTLTPPGERISMKRPSPNAYELEEMRATLLAMLAGEGSESQGSTAELAPPVMASLEATQSSMLAEGGHMDSRSTNTGRAIPALGDRNVNAALSQRLQGGIQQRQGLTHSGSIPSRRDQRRNKTSTEDGKKEVQSDLMQTDESQDELQSKDPKYDISKKRL